MRTERVTFEADGVRLVGDLHLPDADGPRPAWRSPDRSPG